MNSRLNTRLRTTRIDNNVCASAQLALLDKFLRILLCGHAIALERVRRRVLQRKLNPLIIDIHCYDLARAIRLRNSTAQQPDGPRAENNNAVEIGRAHV